MSNSCWLPELEYLDDYQNSWQLYENALYRDEIEYVYSEW